MWVFNLEIPLKSQINLLAFEIEEQEVFFLTVSTYFRQIFIKYLLKCVSMK